MTFTETAQAAERPMHRKPPRDRSAAPIVSSQEDGDHKQRDPQNGAVADTTAVTSHRPEETPSAGARDERFTDPQVMELVQLHRLRRRWMKARHSLTHQATAICRAFMDGDKEAGAKAFARMLAGKQIEGDEILEAALIPFIPAIDKFDDELKAIEKRLAKLAKGLPIYAWAKTVRGFAEGSVAAIVGEAGDLSKYPTVSGVWKRMGLAVINGERQRRVTDPDMAALHGYSPERRSVAWVMADALTIHQRAWVDKETGEIRKEAGPYGVLLSAEKAKALAKGWPVGRAENHAKRVMSKALLRDMTLQWRAINKE